VSSIRYAVLAGTQLAELQPAGEKTIHLEHFLDPTPMAPVLFAWRSTPRAPAGRLPTLCSLGPFVRSRRWALGCVVVSGQSQTAVAWPVGPVPLVVKFYHPALCIGLALRADQKLRGVVGRTAENCATAQDLRLSLGIRGMARESEAGPPPYSRCSRV
jgi:hypothetical protein